jgi:hypothetical protein
MSENANNPTEKAESSTVEDIMADAPEAQQTPEQHVETGIETVERPTPVVVSAKEAAPAPKVEAARKDAVPAAPKDPELMQVERVLEDEDLWDLYRKLTPAQREAFREHGERIARTFRAEFGHPGMDPVKVQKDIEEWLSKVPGIYPGYVRQAALVKSRDIVALSQEHAGL